MANQRKPGKKFIGWQAEQEQRERIDAAASLLGVDRSALLSRFADEGLARITPATPEPVKDPR